MTDSQINYYNNIFQELNRITCGGNQSDTQS